MANTAFAINPSICDPETKDCKCPDDGSYDTCYEIKTGNLMSPDDPKKLRQIAGSKVPGTKI
jgi:hypothetical protein